MRDGSRPFAREIPVLAQARRRASTQGEREQNDLLPLVLAGARHRRVAGQRLNFGGPFKPVVGLSGFLTAGRSAKSCQALESPNFRVSC
jgi:hypothetical protein